MIPARTRFPEEWGDWFGKAPAQYYPERSPLKRYWQLLQTNQTAEVNGCAGPVEVGCEHGNRRENLLQTNDNHQKLACFQLRRLTFPNYWNFFPLYLSQIKILQHSGSQLTWPLAASTCRLLVLWVSWEYKRMCLCADSMTSNPEWV